MTASDRLERELRFLWEIDGSLMGYENAGEDRITVQGVADCVFGKKMERSLSITKPTGYPARKNWRTSTANSSGYTG